MKSRLLLLLLTASLLALAAGNSCAQDPWANWKPSVGDRFVYYHTFSDGTYWHGVPYMVNGGTDTLTMEILSIDSAYNDSYQHVVTVWNSIPQRKMFHKSFYYYHPGKNSASAHPFAIDIGDTLCANCATTHYDFSIAVDTQVTYQASSLKVYAFEHDSEINGNPNAHRSAAAQFSKAHKWFYYTSSSDYEPGQDPYYDGSTASITLVSATTVRSAVEEQAREYA